MFRFDGDPFHGREPWSAGTGPLGDLQNRVASILNAADQNHIYVPTGPGNPIVTVPRPQFPAGYYRQAVHPGQQWAGDTQRASLGAQAMIVFFILAVVAVAPVWVFTGNGIVTAIVAAADAALSLVLYVRARRRVE